MLRCRAELSELHRPSIKDLVSSRLLCLCTTWGLTPLADKMVPGIYAARTNFTLSAEDAEIAQANGRFIRRPEED